MTKRFTLLCRKPGYTSRKHPFNQAIQRSTTKEIFALCILALTLLLSACTISNPFSQPSQSGVTTALPSPSPTQLVTPSPAFTPRAITPQISSSCPATVASYKWDSFLKTQPGVNKVQLVTCGSLEGAGSLEAVVGVGYYTPDAKLDVYVFDNLNGTPTQTFKLTGLIQGDARISPTGTLMTAEVGPKSISMVIPDLFKEYQWNQSTFTQTLFPFVYPDMTHYMAEQNNAIVTAQLAAGKNNNAWEVSCTGEAGHLANNVLRWTNITTVVQKFIKATDTIVVQLTNLGTGGGGFIATCHHLDGNANNILEIASITPLDAATTITSPAANVQLTSPVTVTGVALAGSKMLGEIIVYDGTYFQVGNSGPIGSSGSSYVTFSNVVHYNLNASGIQEGVVALLTTTQNNLALTSQVMMVKVFLSA